MTNRPRGISCCADRDAPPVTAVALARASRHPLSTRSAPREPTACSCTERVPPPPLLRERTRCSEGAAAGVCCLAAILAILGAGALLQRVRRHVVLLFEQAEEAPCSECSGCTGWALAPRHGGGAAATTDTRAGSPDILVCRQSGRGSASSDLTIHPAERDADTCRCHGRRGSPLRRRSDAGSCYMYYGYVDGHTACGTPRVRS